MPGSYSAAVEEIKSRCNIVDIVSSAVSLQRNGRNYKACCPFHGEKTPSFFVSEDRQSFHCFGCGAHGDAISFVQRYYNLGFTDAVDRIAKEYGIVIEEKNSGSGKKKDPYYQINRMAAGFFYDSMRKGPNKGADYMKGRKIDPEILQKFGIGYSDEEWTSLTDYLTKSGITSEMLLELGLSSQKNNRLFDKFRGRVIFPIINTQGKVIGFGGRIIGDGEPKYLNSQESCVFQKKMNLYGLNLTRQEIQKEGFAILVEGYMDVIGLYQGGVKNVAASLGTALTPEQAKLLSRYTHKVVLCYDADGAGIKAAIRGIDVLRAAGLDVSVLHVDDGKDPDEYIKKHGKDDFLELVKKKSLPDVEYKVALIAKKYDVHDTVQSISFFKAVVNVLKGLGPIEQDIYTRLISQKYNISEGALRAEAGNLQKAAAGNTSERKTEHQEDKPSNLENMLIRLMMLKSSYIGEIRNRDKVFDTAVAQRIFDAFNALYVPGEEVDIEELKNNLDGEALDHLYYVSENIETGSNDAQAFDDCIMRIETQKKMRRIEEIKDILSLSSSADVTDEALNELTAELSELVRQIKIQ